MMGPGCFFRAGAQPAAQGHRSYLGAGVRRCEAARQQVARGHRGYLGAGRPSVVIDNMDAVVAATLAERRRRALYLGDERAPEFSTAHQNFFTPQGA